MVLQGGPMPGEMIPIFGMVSGMVVVVALAYLGVRVANGLLGQALARRIQGKNAPMDSELREEVLTMRQDIANLERRLSETEERLDFTERLLAAPKSEPS